MATISNAQQLLDYVQRHIICDICEKPVERVARELSFEFDAYRFKVWCHGDEDNCVLSRQIIEDMLGDWRALQPGRAFTTPRLERSNTEAATRCLDQVEETDRR